MLTDDTGKSEWLSEIEFSEEDAKYLREYWLLKCKINFAVLPSSRKAKKSSTKSDRKEKKSKRKAKKSKAIARDESNSREDKHEVTEEMHVDVSHNAQSMKRKSSGEIVRDKNKVSKIEADREPCSCGFLYRARDRVYAEFEALSDKKYAVKIFEGVIEEVIRHEQSCKSQPQYLVAFPCDGTFELMAEKEFWPIEMGERFRHCRKRASYYRRSSNNS